VQQTELYGDRARDQRDEQQYEGKIESAERIRKIKGFLALS